MDLEEITNYLKKYVPNDLVHLIFKFVLYQHQMNDKYHNVYNVILNNLPKLEIVNYVGSIYHLNIYYKPKYEYGCDENGYEFTKSIYYHESIHISPYVYFIYSLRRLKRTIHIEEVTNCSINDRDEYLKWTRNNKKKKSVLFEFSDDY